MNPLAAAVLAMVMAVSQPNYPLDQELESKFEGQSSVKMVCKVSKVKDIYVYMYSIKNTGTKPIKIKWDLINRAMHFGSNIDLVIELEPNENAIFSLEHPDPPVQVGGTVTNYYLTNSSKLENMINEEKKAKIEISKKAIYRSETSYSNGALPKSFVTPRYR